MSVQHSTGKTIRITTGVTVFRNKVLRRNVWRGEGTGGWRKLQNEELYHLCSSPNIKGMKSEVIMWAWHVVRVKYIQIFDLKF
jgi:hypothetical protein